jgi:AcrR family transcriptional regulator
MGLRERKKAQTRRAIEDAAFRLFEKRGYHATTVADLAEAADIAPRTFFAYFPSKEAVVFGDFDARFGDLETWLGERAEGETTFEAFRAWVRHLREQDNLQDVSAVKRRRVRRKLIKDNEELSTYEHRIMGRYERLIAENVARDLNDEPDGLRPRLIAAAAVAAMAAIAADQDESAKGGNEPDEQLDYAFAFLRGGIAALLERDASPHSTR